MLVMASLLLLGAAPSPWVNDFDEFWKTIDTEDVYVDHSVWKCVQKEYRPRAAQAATRSDFVRVLEAALEELHDTHTHLNTNFDDSFRLVPSGLEVWAEWQGDVAVVTQLRSGSPAERAGLEVGERITQVGSQPIKQAALARLGPCSTPDQATLGWALRSVLAGQHDRPRRWSVEGANATRRELRPDDVAPVERPAVSVEHLDGGVALISVRVLGDSATVTAFNDALETVKDAPGLLLDLSDTAAGGNTDVAEPILGRFIDHRQGYQRIVPLHQKPWVKQVAPSGRWQFKQPLVVLVSRWTGSMGEGMAMGLDGLHRATVVGSAMAGLKGAVFTHTLKRSGVAFNYPGKRLTHLDGRPRDSFLPTVLVEPCTDASRRAAGLRTLLGLP